MGRKRNPGLYKRNGIWQIDKKVSGHRICESTGTGDLDEAEKYLVKKIEEVRQAERFGVRPKRTFSEAAIKFLQENQHKRSIKDDVSRLKKLVNHIGDIALERVSMHHLQGFIAERRREGVKSATINHALKLVRRITNLASGVWTDSFGLTWLAHAPKIVLLPVDDAKEPNPLTWDEQKKLFAQLPEHLRDMALFTVNTGCRDQEVCQLRWEWEVAIEEFPQTCLFIIPAEMVKNGDDRLVVCNRIAAGIVEKQRGQHPTHVFHYRGKPKANMLSTGWETARDKVLLDVRVHDLKHTFGRRLRSAGVSYEDRQDLLGHRSGRMTTHYSAAELQNLLDAANKVCEPSKSGVVLKLLRRSKRKTVNAAAHGDSAQPCGDLMASSRKSPVREFCEKG